MHFCPTHIETAFFQAVNSNHNLNVDGSINWDFVLLDISLHFFPETNHDKKLLNGLFRKLVLAHEKAKLFSGDFDELLFA